jgi:hypothetical protein
VTEVIPIIGDDGLQFKVFVRHAFAQNYKKSAAQAFEEGTVALPKLMIMPTTSAANCGVSSSNCHCSYRTGFPLSMYALVQELGPIDHDPMQILETIIMRFFFPFSCLVALYVQIMQTSKKMARDSNLFALFKVLNFIVLPTTCHHIMME